MPFRGDGMKLAVFNILSVTAIFANTNIYLIYNLYIHVQNKKTLPGTAKEK